MQKVVIDCDVGTDDAQALLIALSQPHVKVVAITAVFGNATLDNTSTNILRVLKLCDRLDIPVYKGCSVCLRGGAFASGTYHGLGGLGDVTLPGIDPIDRSILREEHASQALVRIAKENKGELTLVALGPLTNIALALHLDQDFGANLKDCVFMGGNTKGRGNVTVCGEFNFHSDPEAVHFVLNHLQCPATIVPLEMCYRNALPWEWYDELIKTPTKKAQFVKNMEESIIKRERDQGMEGYILIDQQAMAVAVDPTVATETQAVYATMECRGDLTRGMLVVDWQNKLGKKSNVKLVKNVDQGRLIELLHVAVGKD